MDVNLTASRLRSSKSTGTIFVAFTDGCSFGSGKINFPIGTGSSSWNS